MRKFRRKICEGKNMENEEKCLLGKEKEASEEYGK